MKKFLIILAFLFIIFPNVHAGFDHKDYDFSKNIVDNANVLSQSDKIMLMDKISEIANKFNYSIVILTSNDVPKGKYVEYADDFYDYNHYGFDKKNSGSLMLIDFNNRQIHISTTGDVIPILTDYRIDNILDKVAPLSTKKQYTNAFMSYLNSLSKYFIKYDKNVSLIDKITIYHIIIPAIAGLLSAIFYSIFIKKRYTLEYNTYKYDFRAHSYVNILNSDVTFINSHTVTSKIISDNSSSGFSGGSSTHTGSSGTIHGGGSRGF